MRPMTCAFAAAAVLLGSSVSTLSGADKSARPPGGGQPVEYHMSGQYMFGCFGLCLCALHWYDELSGGFTLTPIDSPGGPGGGLQLYTITDFHLDSSSPAGDEVHITGSGAYSIFTDDGVTQSMELDLTFNGLEVAHFHSGHFQDSDGSQFPAINISLSVGELICSDSIVSFAAGPANQSADLDQDGDVDGLDLAQLLAGWGGCPLLCVGCCCTTDINCDGLTNGFDLAILLAAWTGPK